MLDLQTTRNISRISLFTALIAAGSYITVPIPGSPAPVVLANLFAVLAGIVLGPGGGGLAAGLYLLLGLAGLPIFAAGSGGLAYLAGPTGGYLVGYMAAALTSGIVFRLLTRRPQRRLIAAGAVSATAGLLIIYVPGVAWMSLVLDLSTSEALVAGILPFLPGDIAKAGAAALLLPALERSPARIATHHDTRGL